MMWILIVDVLPLWLFFLLLPSIRLKFLLLLFFHFFCIPILRVLVILLSDSLFILFLVPFVVVHSFIILTITLIFIPITTITIGIFKLSIIFIRICLYLITVFLHPHWLSLEVHQVLLLWLLILETDPSALSLLLQFLYWLSLWLLFVSPLFL